jgi:hypothetical protein
LERSLVASADWHPGLARYWDFSTIRQEAERVLTSADPSMKEVMGISRALASMIQLSSWWLALEG